MRRDDPIPLPYQAGASPSPKTDREQTIAVMGVLMQASGPLDAAAIAATFKPAPKVRSAVADVLQAMFRMGQVASTDSTAFALRRVA